MLPGYERARPFFMCLVSTPNYEAAVAFSDGYLPVMALSTMVFVVHDEGIARSTWRQSAPEKIRHETLDCWA